MDAKLSDYNMTLTYLPAGDGVQCRLVVVGPERIDAAGQGRTAGLATFAAFVAALAQVPQEQAGAVGDMLLANAGQAYMIGLRVELRNPTGSIRLPTLPADPFPPADPSPPADFWSQVPEGFAPTGDRVTHELGGSD